jgi:WD40 repeat protein/tRNA A-37 threonylcarbamoyl transferase component Bud32
LEPPPSTTGPSAEDLFADYLELLEAGEQVEFEAWAAEHPVHIPALRRMHQRWHAMAAAFATMSGSPGGRAATGDSASLTSLLQGMQKGSRWSRYAIGSEIARGAMGRVVVAWDQELRRDVALKIQRGPATDGRQQRRFVEEAQIAAQLDHPGIVPIHELGTDPEGRPFFAMRLVRGAELGAVLEMARTGAEGWSRTRVLHVLLRVCEALEYAHHKGVVHRDLKPANVMVGHFGEAYVMDWGLARVLGSRAPSTTPGVDTVSTSIAREDQASPLLTHHGDVVGTPAYMAPEQAAGGEDEVTPAVDVYAIGAILYHLLRGAPPYQPTQGSSTANEVLTALREGPPPPLPDTAPGELRAICERAMARLPDDRYPDVASLARDLRAFLELRVVSAYATGRFAELRKWIARNRAIAALSVGVVLSLAAGVVATSTLWWTAERAHLEADATAARLADELDRSRFRNARLALRSDDVTRAGDALYQHHLAGRMPRASSWSLVELAERNPLLATRPIAGNLMPVFSRPTGSVLMAGQDGALHVFDAQTLATRTRLTRDDSHFVSVFASAKQPWAAAGDRAGGVTFWDLTEGQPQTTIRAHDSAVIRLDGPPDDIGFASLDEAGDVCWWPAPCTPPQKVTNVGPGATSLAVEANGGRIAIGTESGRLLVFTPAGVKQIDRQIGSDQLVDLSFTPDGRELWVGSRAITIVDLESGSTRRTILSRNGTYRSLIHETDGSVIAGGWWRVDRFSGEPAVDTPLALVGCWKLDLDPVARRIVSKRGTAALDLIDISQRDLRTFPGARPAIALARDGRSAATVLGRDVVRFDLASGRESGRIPGIGNGWLATDRNGGRIAVVRRGEQGVTVADFASGKVLYRLDGASETPFNESAEFSPDGARLAVVVGEDRIRVHAAADGAQLAEFTVPGAQIIRLRHSADGAHLAVGWRQGRVVRIFDLRAGSFRDVPFELLRQPTQSTIASIAVDAHAERVAIGAWSGSIVVVDTRPGGSPSRQLQAHSGTVWSLCFSPTDPGLLLSSAGSGGITFWDLDSGEACYQPSRLEGTVAQLQISDDGSVIACQTNQGPMALDLQYRERHLAGTIDHMLERGAGTDAAPSPERLRRLRAWADAVMARPWPRWE